MKKIALVIVLVLISILNVQARVYPELNKYDFSKWGELQLDLTGVDVTIKKIVEISDGYLFITTYRESDDRIPAYNSAGEKVGMGTKLQEHTKITKFDKNFNKIFEQKFYLLLKNSEHPDPLAPTVGTTATNIAELSNGNIIISGTLFGYTTVGHSESFYTIFDKDGNKLFQKVFEYSSNAYIKNIAALTNGEYIVKYDVRQNDVTNILGEAVKNQGNQDSIYYVIYNENNEIVEYFSDGENYKLSNLDFLEDNMEEVMLNNDLTFRDINMAGDIVKVSSTDATITVGSETIDLKKMGYDTPLSISGKGLLIFNDNSMLFGRTLIDSNGKFVTELEPGGANYFVTSSGDILSYTNPFRGYVRINKPINKELSNNFEVNLIVDGEKINYNIGAFVENERTYLNLNNLCSVLHCTFSTSKSNPELIILRFDIMRHNNQIPEDFKTYSTTDNVKYTITHVIGSREYNSYLEFLNGKVFKLKSPTFTSDSVDVTSKYVDNQVYVPLRFVSEALGRYVEYFPTGENDLPTITITGQGEGEFYEKYGVGISYSRLEDNSILTNNLDYNDEVIDLYDNKLYTYGIEKDTNKIIDSTHTIFYPISEMGFLPGRDVDSLAGEIDNVRYKNEEAGYLVAINNYLYEKRHVEIGSDIEDYGKMTVVAISNIEGYPFIRLINVMGF